MGAPQLSLASSAASSADEVITSIDAAHRVVCAGEYELLLLAARVDALGLWESDGARDCACWLAARYGITVWKAGRWIAAGQALPLLPAVGAALRDGRLSLDKVIELTRFAQPETEAALVRWASQVNPATIRRRGDLALRVADDAHAERFARWWFTSDHRLVLEAELAAAEGAAVAKALERLAAQMPADDAEARAADALVALAQASLGEDPDLERATVVVHASLSSLQDGGSAELEDGPVIDAQTARRLSCGGRVQTVVEDQGNVVYVSAAKRLAPAWMQRQVRYRDRGCVFPGCGTRRFTQAHHIRFWRHGGTTSLENMALVCSFHHRLVHEGGWSMARGRDHMIRWHRPDGTRYRAGPGQ